MPSIAEVLHNEGYKNFAESITTKQGKEQFRQRWEGLVIKNYQFFKVNETFDPDLSEALQKVSILLIYDEVWDSRNEWWWQPFKKIAKPYVTVLLYTALVKLKKRGINVI